MLEVNHKYEQILINSQLKIIKDLLNNTNLKQRK